MNLFNLFRRKPKGPSMTFIHRICGATDGLKDVTVYSVQELYKIPYLNRGIENELRISPRKAHNDSGWDYYLMSGSGDHFMVAGFLHGDRDLIETIPGAPKEYRD